MTNTILKKTVNNNSIYQLLVIC